MVKIRKGVLMILERRKSQFLENEPRQFVELENEA